MTMKREARPRVNLADVLPRVDDAPMPADMSKEVYITIPEFARLVGQGVSTAQIYNLFTHGAIREGRHAVGERAGKLLKRAIRLPLLEVPRLTQRIADGFARRTTEQVRRRAEQNRFYKAQARARTQPAEAPVAPQQASLPNEPCAQCGEKHPRLSDLESAVLSALFQIRKLQLHQLEVLKELLDVWKAPVPVASAKKLERDVH